MEKIDTFELILWAVAGWQVGRLLGCLVAGPINEILDKLWGELYKRILWDVQ